MPELPEVETTVNQLQRRILKKKVIDVWCDNCKMLRKIAANKVINTNFEDFRKNITGRKIKSVKRRGKNILIELNDDKILLIHQKLTGHLLVGKWQMLNGKWQPTIKGPLKERVNKYIHLVFSLDDGKMLVLSDLRKFAKVIYGEKPALLNLPEIKNLGPELLKKDFAPHKNLKFSAGITFKKFKEALLKRKGKTKQVLMNQEVIAGIGNIYSDEILWQAKINPFKELSHLTQKELKRIYAAMIKVLKKAIELQGESISDWRDIEGEKGGYDRTRKVYRRKGEPCLRCGAKIQRKKIGGRSAHFCPACQSL